MHEDRVRVREKKEKSVCVCVCPCLCVCVGDIDAKRDSLCAHLASSPFARRGAGGAHRGGSTPHGPWHHAAQPGRAPAHRGDRAWVQQQVCLVLSATSSDKKKPSRAFFRPRLPSPSPFPAENPTPRKEQSCLSCPSCSTRCAKSPRSSSWTRPAAPLWRAPPRGPTWTRA